MTVENFQLTARQIENPDLSCCFVAIILSPPTCDLVLGNLPDIQSPSETDVQRWNERHGFSSEEPQPTSAVFTRASARREKKTTAVEALKQDTSTLPEVMITYYPWHLLGVTERLS